MDAYGVALKRTFFFSSLFPPGWNSGGKADLTTETVESASLPLQGVDDVHGRDGLSLGVFGVGDGVPDDVLEEDLQDTASFLVDEAGDALHSTAASQTTDGGLRDALDVVTQDLAVALGTTLPESLSSLATTGHGSTMLSELTESECAGARPPPTMYSPALTDETIRMVSFVRALLAPCRRTPSPFPALLSFSLATFFFFSSLPPLPSRKRADEPERGGTLASANPSIRPPCLFLPVWTMQFPWKPIAKQQEKRKK